MSGCLGFRCNKSLSFYLQEENTDIFVTLETSYTRLCPDGVQTANIGHFYTHHCLSALYIHTQVKPRLYALFITLRIELKQLLLILIQNDSHLLPRDAQITLGFGHPFTSPNRGVYVTAGVCLFMS